MKIWSDSFKDGEPIPTTYALGRPNPETHAEVSDNKNPHLAFSDLPEGAKSLVLICNDPDVPSKPDDVNQEGKTVPADLPRVDFRHWVMVDLPPDASPIAEGEFAAGMTVRGKDGPEAPRGARHGLNDYTGWFAGDADMEGNYFGYDGPWPPWNDSIIHHYHFTVYALDLDRCPVDGVFSAPDVLAAIDGHILDQATIVGTYHINPDAK